MSQCQCSRRGRSARSLLRQEEFIDFKNAIPKGYLALPEQMGLTLLELVLFSDVLGHCFS